MTSDASARDRRRLTLAFVANVLMFFVGLVGWRLAQSTALLGDALDMLADASAYAIAFLAVDGSAIRQRRAAQWNGTMLIVLGISVLAEVAYRWTEGGEPSGPWIAAFACLSLTVNALVLLLLAPYRDSHAPHLRATWVDTRADVLVNVGGTGTSTSVPCSSSYTPSPLSILDQLPSTCSRSHACAAAACREGPL